jgi:hypothetical protein
VNAGQARQPIKLSKPTSVRLTNFDSANRKPPPIRRIRRRSAAVRHANVSQTTRRLADYRGSAEDFHRAATDADPQ